MAVFFLGLNVLEVVLGIALFPFPGIGREFGYAPSVVVAKNL